MRGLRSTNRWLQNNHGDVKYSVGNGVAKETTHDLWTRAMVWGLPEGLGRAGCREGGREKHWDNYNSIINKI